MAPSTLEEDESEEDEDEDEDISAGRLLKSRLFKSADVSLSAHARSGRKKSAEQVLGWQGYSWK